MRSCGLAAGSSSSCSSSGRAPTAASTSAHAQRQHAAAVVPRQLQQQQHHAGALCHHQHRPRGRTGVLLRAVTPPKMMLAGGLVDYYELMGVDDDAPVEEIKKAYRSLAKECHPDYLGDEGHNICILLNEAYEVLMDDDARANYNAQLEVALNDEDDDYTGEPLSKWIPASNPKMARNEDPQESRAVFVDENACIGCKQCVWHAPGCFRIEPEHGRSRVFAQWLNTEDDLQAAIDSCPVNCIHWVQRDELPALEYVMQNRVERVNVGVMMAGQGRVSDVFSATASFMKERKRKEEEALRAKRRYSPQQEEARRQASEALLRDHMGFLANLFKAAVNEMASTVEGTGDGARVGRRQRAQRWYERSGASTPVSSVDDLGGDYFMVPPERALVPITVSAQKKDD